MLNRIVEDPYFYDVESIVVHVGVNDVVESETHPDIMSQSIPTGYIPLGNPRGFAQKNCPGAGIRQGPGFCGKFKLC